MNGTRGRSIVWLVLGALLLPACGQEQDRLSPLEEFILQGDRAYADQNLQKAVDLYQKALQTGAQTVKLHNNLGNAFFMDRRFNAAQQSYLKALELDPEYLPGLNNLALSLFHAGEIEDAYRLVEEAKETFPTVSFFQTTYGYFRYSEGDSEGALEAFTRAVELNPDSPAALNNIGVLYMEDENSLEDPLPYLKRALDKGTSNALFHDSLGWYYYKKGEFADATIEIGKALLFDPTNLDVLIHYASVLEWIGKDQEALEQWDKIHQTAEDSRIRKLALKHSWEIRGRIGTTTAPQ